MRIFPVLIAVVAVALAGCNSTSSSTQSSPTQTGPTQTPGAGGAACVYNQSGEAAKQVSLPPTAGVPNTGSLNYVLTLDEDPVGLTLFSDKAPCTVNSFTSLAGQGYFDNLSCHRLTTAGIFVLQCGDPTGTGSGGPGYQFDDELSGSETYPAGTLAMANAGPGTNGSQFFVVYGDSALGADYTVFGKVDSKGLKVVQEIAAGGTDNAYNQGDGHPLLPAVINSVRPS